MTRGSLVPASAVLAGCALRKGVPDLSPGAGTAPQACRGSEGSMPGRRRSPRCMFVSRLVIKSSSDMFHRQAVRGRPRPALPAGCGGQRERGVQRASPGWAEVLPLQAGGESRTRGSRGGPRGGNPRPALETVPAIVAGKPLASGSRPD